MIFKETPLKGCYLIKPERFGDERGHLARTFCRDEFAKHGLTAEVAQCSTTMTAEKGAVRGMHFQVSPHEEDKLVRCVSGAIYDVAVDIRDGSATRGRWFAAELSRDNGEAVFIPKGFAHGFQALAGNVEVFYQMSAAYDPAAAMGYRWDDPAFAIDWPLAVGRMSERDRGWPDFSVEKR
ncbi:MAG TPA: dTDP-4-dehydrorhamnose 3,5-epimerase [Alphaproteobacteria bacterium]|nr:dTDP-4-dehydrorhamnose 3,5-epimerase [Alphaproteobacteria bacterium]